MICNNNNESNDFDVTLRSNFNDDDDNGWIRVGYVLSLYPFIVYLCFVCYKNYLNSLSIAEFRFVIKRFPRLLGTQN